MRQVLLTGNRSWADLLRVHDALNAPVVHHLRDNSAGRHDSTDSAIRLTNQRDRAYIDVTLSEAAG